MKKFKLSKIQLITVVAWLLFAIWSVAVNIWQQGQPADDPIIRVDLILFMPILIALTLISIAQLVKHIPQQPIRWLIYAILGVVSLVLAAGIYRFNFTNDDIIMEATSKSNATLSEVVVQPVENQSRKKQLQQILYADDAPLDADYLMTTADLNQDGQAEWLVVVQSLECGTGGCPFYVIQSPENAPKIILDFAPALGAFISSDSTNGWKNISVTIGDFSDDAPEQIEMSFDKAEQRYDFSPAAAEKIEHESGDNFNNN